MLRSRVYLILYIDLHSVYRLNNAKTSFRQWPSKVQGDVKPLLGLKQQGYTRL